MAYLLKDPAARVRFDAPWTTGDLAGRSITASSWAVLPAESGGVTAEASGLEATRSWATLAGGAAGHVYRATNRITLSDGAIDERSVTVRVEER